MGESTTGPRATLIGIVAGLLLVSAVTWGQAAPQAPTAAAASPRPSPPATTTSTTSTSTRPTTTSTRVLPRPPVDRTPVPAPPGRLAPVYSRLPIAEKVIFLGIDDGMVRDPEVLYHLDALDVPFTVFLTMGPAQEDPAFWRRAVLAGGEIQSHTMTHPDLTRVSGATLRQEVCGTVDPYQAMFGNRPTLFRPPFGKSNDAVRRQAAECGYRGVILWKGSTNNGRLTMQEGPLHAGDILLLHWRDTLRDDIDDVVARCRQEGFAIGRLEDYLRT